MQFNENDQGSKKAPDLQDSLIIADLDPVYLELFLLRLNPDKIIWCFSVLRIRI
jgi:hypothetical protein